MKSHTRCIGLVLIALTLCTLFVAVEGRKKRSDDRWSKKEEERKALEELALAREGEEDTEDVVEEALTLEQKMRLRREQRGRAEGAAETSQWDLTTKEGATRYFRSQDVSRWRDQDLEALFSLLDEGGPDLDTFRAMLEEYDAKRRRRSAKEATRLQHLQRIEEQQQLLRTVGSGQ